MRSRFRIGLAVLSLVLGLRDNGAAQTIRKRSDDTLPLETVVQQQGETIQALQTSLQALRAELTSVKADLDRVVANAGKSVAFLTHFSTDPINDIGQHATLKFDSVTYNLGNAYNPVTGTFAAPFPGLYVFFVSMMGSDTQGPIDVYITKSGTPIEGAYAKGNGDLHDQGSTLVTLHLTAGEQVWVQHQWGATSLMGGEYTIFSGFLLHADL